MWSNTTIEKCLKEKLFSKFKEEDAEKYYALYVSAKKYLCNNIYSEIKAVEPDLTDHSDKHIQNVLEMSWKLIVDEDGNCNFEAIEIYLLCICILFHDVGNLLGRDGHNVKVANIYNRIRGNDMFCNQERQLVLKIVKAHCGTSKRGDKDTLLDVDILSHLYDSKIRMREIAAILRLADELSEGPQRTSQYMLECGKFAQSSLIYHKYASITQIHIDGGNGRLVLTYNIDYPVEEHIDFKEFLRFVYKRILKLDTERRYCKYYAPSLDKLKKTEASINFTINGDICDYDLPKICLEDKYSLVEEDIDLLIASISGLDDVDTTVDKLQDIKISKFGG